MHSWKAMGLGLLFQSEGLGDGCTKQPAERGRSQGAFKQIWSKGRSMPHITSRRTRCIFPSSIFFEFCVSFLILKLSTYKLTYKYLINNVYHDIINFFTQYCFGQKEETIITYKGDSICKFYSPPNYLCLSMI